MKTTKSQAAMEFLMTYGWALLVVIIVIAALAFFGLLNPTRFLPEKCDFGPGLTCMDFSAETDDPQTSNGDAGDPIVIILNNGIAATMSNITLNITQCKPGVVWAGYGTFANTTTIPEGSSFKFSVPCSGMVGNTRFKSDVILTYNTSAEDESVRHVKKGFILVNVQKTG